MEENAIEKMLRMMDKFEDLCCGRDQTQRSHPGNYTNFSVNEILKPEFGPHYKNNCYHQKMADIVSSTDEFSDLSSDSGDFSSSENEIRESDSPDSQCLQPSFRTRKNAYIPNEALFQYSYTDVQPFTLLDRIRRHYLEEDGYTSSDSETALDLRIERKKTPPQNSVPAWVFCTRYSDRPSAGPRAKRRRRSQKAKNKRNRVAFNDYQLHQLITEFKRSPYLTDERRQELAKKLNLNEANVKIWFQNKRAKLKKETFPNPLAVQLMKQGLYNHKSVRNRNEIDNSDSDVSYGSTC